MQEGKAEKPTEPVCLGRAPPIFGMSVGIKVLPFEAAGGAGGGAGLTTLAGAPLLACSCECTDPFDEGSLG